MMKVFLHCLLAVFFVTMSGMMASSARDTNKQPAYATLAFQAAQAADQQTTTIKVHE